MLQEIAYRSMTGQNVSRNKLALKYKVSAGILTIAQHKGYIEKQGGGKYIIKAEFTDLIINELYSEHANKNKVKPVDDPQLKAFGPSYTPHDQTDSVTGFDLGGSYNSNDVFPENLQEDDFKDELKSFNHSEFLSGIYKRIADEFINLSNFYKS